MLHSLEHAAEAEARAHAVADPKLRAEYEQLAKAWRTLARSYEFQRSLGHFIAFRTSQKTDLEPPNSKQISPTQEHHLVGAASSRSKSRITTLRARIQRAKLVVT